MAAPAIRKLLHAFGRCTVRHQSGTESQKLDISEDVVFFLIFNTENTIERFVVKFIAEDKEKIRRNTVHQSVNSTIKEDD